VTAAMTVIAPILAAIVAITVPAIAFRFARMQEHEKWARDRRADVYIDLLAEANAHLAWLLHTINGRSTDPRASEAERHQIGTRALIFAAPEVVRIFTSIADAAGANQTVAHRAWERHKAKVLEETGREPLPEPMAKDMEAAIALMKHSLIKLADSIIKDLSVKPTTGKPKRSLRKMSAR
jgi:hypothetical protein